MVIMGRDKQRRLILAAAASAALGLSGCGGGSTAQQGNIDTLLPAGTATTASQCDPLDPAYCLFPFPNDYYTAVDRSTDTGRRVNLQVGAMPVSTASKKPIDPAEWNRNDGFSPGPMLLTYVPGIDLDQTGAPRITDISRSLAADSPIVMIDADSLEQQLVWAELDENNVSAPDRQALIIRTARNLEYGHRYIVALRNLRDANGQPIEPSAAFRIYRDNHASDLGFINARRAHMESLFTTLSHAGIARKDLYLAWDFTVASQRNLTARMLHIRDDAFASFAGGIPDFQISQVSDFTVDQDPLIARIVTGSVTVPTYLNQADTEGSNVILAAQLRNLLVRHGGRAAELAQRVGPDAALSATRTVFNYADNASPGINDLPVRIPGATLQAPFTCIIPRSVLNGDGSVTPARIALYGHGLFGSRNEVTAGNVKAMADEHNFVFCATNWYGFSEDDLPNALITLLDLSNARSLFDTTQQGFLNMLVLGRAMLSPNGLAAQPAFKMGSPSASVLDNSALYFDGNSEGGIFGGALMSVAQDIRKGVLGVPGMNYSFLLERSVDFSQYSIPLYLAYPDSFDEELDFSLLQMLWDRAEVSGYANNMTDHPLPNTPPHQVLMQVAFGDHQVSMWSAEAEARTIGAQLHCPALEPGRHPDTVPYFGLDCMTDDTVGHHGSAIVIWDSGPDKVPAPPTTNVPPDVGGDPHGDPRSTPAARVQKSDFLQAAGTVVDVCGGKPCGAAGYVPP